MDVFKIINMCQLSNLKYFAYGYQLTTNIYIHIQQISKENIDQNMCKIWSEAVRYY